MTPSTSSAVIADLCIDRVGYERTVVGCPPTAKELTESPLQILERYRREAHAEPAPPAQRRTRGRIKRLKEVFDATQARHWDDPPWREERAWYVSIGLDPADVHRIFRTATLQRRYYEDRLEARLLARSESAPWKRRQLRILRGAQPFLGLMKAWPESSGDLAARVEAWIEEFLARHIEEVDPAHRPGEDWAQKPAKDLAQLFMQRKQSLARTRRAVGAAFMLAGHADVINAEKVRRIIPNRASVGFAPTP